MRLSVLSRAPKGAATDVLKAMAADQIDARQMTGTLTVHFILRGPQRGLCRTELQILFQ